MIQKNQACWAEVSGLQTGRLLKLVKQKEN
jgi:hypothetical protein